MTIALTTGKASESDPSGRMNRSIVSADDVNGFEGIDLSPLVTGMFTELGETELHLFYEKYLIPNFTNRA